MLTKGCLIGRRGLPPPAAVAEPVPRPKTPYYPSWSNDIPQLENLNDTFVTRFSHNEVQTRKGAPEISSSELHYRNSHTTTIERESSMGASPTGVSVTWLGTSSGNPTVERNVSCTVVQAGSAIFIVDCGEGSHRQLQQANIDISKIESIFITHMHGDHCFGLATTLQMIDIAKAEAASKLSRGLSNTSHGRVSSPEAPQGSVDPTIIPVTRVFGPPGLGELVRVSLADSKNDLRTRVIVTELVVDPDMAGPPVDLNYGVSGDSWRMDQFESREHDDCSLSPSLLMLETLGSLDVNDSPRLQAAATLTHERLLKLRSFWRPCFEPFRPGMQPRTYTHRSGADEGPSMSARASAVQQQHDLKYSGIGYVAQWGRYWELSCGGGARVRAAQLQHRLPCWGYVIEELLPVSGETNRDKNTRSLMVASSVHNQTVSEEESPLAWTGMPSIYVELHEGKRVGRKVVILGDTVSSYPIAPIALNCDLIAHEATFMEGMEPKCRVSQHSTAWMAGAFAEAVKARHLVLTHFSARYSSTMPVPNQRVHKIGGQGGGTSQEWRKRPVDLEAEAEEQTKAVRALLNEARQYYRSGTVSAAEDFYTLRVE
ncbi:hypothetical protein CEUSTIGMA_g7583.t1 [Chlamydomonas eustigma]|uniref:Uncharacterized protein n=1 Tax=Chlamydomonas eustigma TaxID=1157962 RepID=A0A250XAL4_9CHLO|nr:hypothetical protein CEUSTIGMA_g7583.t1 [Chlamydomonas eustigma]|eukprot:GAX80145.1 hypothetical protein CEUSTIGMA_g7583.t1 [Chlamydomonas eustigma]